MVQAGDLIARRFRLVRTEEYDLPGATRFAARDTRLDQEVTVDIISSLAPSSVVRAARGAQVLRDRRLTRMIAAGSERWNGDRITYVVSERPRGVRLDRILGKAALLPATAAAIVAEAAATLADPGHSGVHHGVIRPRSLTITPLGRVTLSGLGVEGELESQAGRGRGRSERVDAVALARIFVTAITAMNADDVTADDLPDNLTDPARDLCEALLRGSGPLTLTQITDALGAADDFALRRLASEAPRLWWSRSPRPIDAARVDASEAVAPPIAEIHQKVDAAADDVDEDDVDEDDLPAVDQDFDEGFDEEDGVAEDVPSESVDPASTRLRTRFGGAVDDIDEFHDIVAAQNVDATPSVAEAVAERLHERFPRSEPLSDLAKAAHRRAQAIAPFNVGPLVLALLIVGVFVAAVIAVSLIAQPLDTPIDGSVNPSPPYPEYTFGPTPTSIPE